MMMVNQQRPMVNTLDYRCRFIDMNFNLDTNAQPTNKKQKKKKNVRFDDVTVYYFARSQGFVSVPSQGTVTLGM